MSRRMPSTGWIDVTSKVPPGTIRRLRGCRPYQAQDSTPLASVSSTQMVTSTCFGSYRAMFCSSSSFVSATMAKSLAGIPFRWGLSPGLAELPDNPPARLGRTVLAELELRPARRDLESHGGQLLERTAVERIVGAERPESTLWLIAGKQPDLLSGNGARIPRHRGHAFEDHGPVIDRKSTRLNSSHRCTSYAVFCLKKKRGTTGTTSQRGGDSSSRESARP